MSGGRKCQPCGVRCNEVSGEPFCFALIHPVPERVAGVRRTSSGVLPFQAVAQKVEMAWLATMGEGGSYGLQAQQAVRIRLEQSPV